MIYFDSAATSLQKPLTVPNAVSNAIRRNASPGRGSHVPAMRAADSVYDCRTRLASYFNVGNPEAVIFTSCASHALSIAINTLVNTGDTVVISGYEHNAVTRPLSAKGAKIRVARSPLFQPEMQLSTFRDALRGASCAICTHVSNVFGYVLPIEEIAELCNIYGVPLIIDASQSAGSIPIDFTALGASFIAMPGHKGLLGPQGTGVLLCGRQADPIIFGGTGSSSTLECMPDFLPDRLEAGTHNVPGICGLDAGVRYLQSCPEGEIFRHESALLQNFADRISNIPNLAVFRSPDAANQCSVLSLVSEKIPSDILVERLGMAGICVRGGMHCAPLAHKTAGTLNSGTARFSFSPFNTHREVERAAQIFKKVLGNA